MNNKKVVNIIKVPFIIKKRINGIKKNTEVWKRIVKNKKVG
jgi:hypothetical protein